MDERCRPRVSRHVSLTMFITSGNLSPYFSDQKIANQNSVRRMRRWYMPLFRQYLEWSILNTGVILRQRPKGKLIWSAIKLKLELAEELQFLGRKETQLNAGGPDVSSDSACEGSPGRLRLRRDILHVPGIASKRIVCRVHKQRKATRLRCLTCSKAICSSICWKRYHKKRLYLFDDPNSTSKVVNIRNID